MMIFNMIGGKSGGEGEFDYSWYSTVSVTVPSGGTRTTHVMRIRSSNETMSATKNIVKTVWVAQGSSTDSTQLFAFISEDGHVRLGTSNTSYTAGSPIFTYSVGRSNPIPTTYTLTKYNPDAVFTTEDMGTTAYYPVKFNECTFGQTQISSLLRLGIEAGDVHVKLRVVYGSSAMFNIDDVAELGPAYLEYDSHLEYDTSDREYVATLSNFVVTCPENLYIIKSSSSSGSYSIPVVLESITPIESQN